MATNAGDTLLEVGGLCVAYGKVEAVRNISLKVGRVPCQVGAPLACRVMVERLAD